MEALTTITSTAVPFPHEDVDTDQIIPARFLKATTREGFGENLFRDWRYLDEDVPNPEFILNKDTHSGEILITGRNFGCGSSREHAAWAIYDYGFRALIGTQFADIFKNNSLNNGILPIETDTKTYSQLLESVETDPKTEIKINLEDQTVSVPSISLTFSFDINPYKKMCLQNGYDDIDYLISQSETIKAFEKNLHS